MVYDFELACLFHFTLSSEASFGPEISVFVIIKAITSFFCLDVLLNAVHVSFNHDSVTGMKMSKTYHFLLLFFDVHFGASKCTFISFIPGACKIRGVDIRGLRSYTLMPIYTVIALFLCFRKRQRLTSKPC